MRILLATDGSACSQVAVEEIARRPWPEESEVRIVAVVEPFVAVPAEPWILPAGYSDEIDRAAREGARAAIDDATARLRARHGDTLRVTSDILVGSPKQAILEDAEAWGADLIVLGSHGYRGLERFLLGSVSQAVATHAKCSVEIVRCRGARGGEGA